MSVDSGTSSEPRYRFGTCQPIWSQENWWGYKVSVGREAVRGLEFRCHGDKEDTQREREKKKTEECNGLHIKEDATKYTGCL